MHACAGTYQGMALHAAQVVAMCSRHHTEISLVADYSSSLSFWCAAVLVSHHLQYFALSYFHYIMQSMPCTAPKAHLRSMGWFAAE